MRIIQIPAPSQIYEGEPKARNAKLAPAEIKPFFSHNVEVLIYWHAIHGPVGLGKAIVRKPGFVAWHYHDLDSCYCGSCYSPTQYINLAQFGTLITLKHLVCPRHAADYEIAPLIDAAYQVAQ